MMNISHNELMQLAKKIYSRLEVTPIYSEVECFDLLNDEVFNFIDLTEECVKEWLSDGFETWINERAPLHLYSKLLLVALIEIRLKCTIMPEDILLRTFKAMIYYGHYTHVITLAERRFYDAENFFTMVKYIAKAYKCLGHYEKSLRYYRIALEKAFLENDTFQLAFFLVLVGKLFDDYHQKKGIHEFYYKTAYFRIKKEATVINNPKNRIAEICTECYVKYLMSKKDINANMLYDDLLNTYSYQNESYYRVFLNRLFAELRNLISNCNNITMSEMEMLSDKIYNIERIIDIIKHNFRNERVFAIRTIQLLSVRRLILEKIVNLSSSKLLEIFTDDMPISYATTTLKNCLSISRKYNEKKYTVYSLLELVRWQMLVNNIEGKDITPSMYDEWASLLIDAKSVLEISKNSPLYLKSDAYIDVLSELAKIYIRKGSYNEASSVFKEIYNHFSFLLHDIKKDSETAKENSINRSEDFGAEYFVLNEHEALEISSFVFHDYESISENLLETGRNIIAIQEKEFMFIFESDEYNRITNDLEHHSITTLINNTDKLVEEIFEGKEVKTDIKENLKEIQNRVDKIKENGNFLLARWRKPERFFMREETMKYLEQNQYIYKSRLSNITISISDSTEDFKIEYIKRHFMLILENVIVNSIEASERQRLQDCVISISFSVATKGSLTIAYLHVTDNIFDEFENFNHIIELLNQKESEKIKHSGNRGNGLSHIRSITPYNEKWRLIKHNNERMKELRIPICRTIN